VEIRKRRAARGHNDFAPGHADNAADNAADNTKPEPATTDIATSDHRTDNHLPLR